MNSPPGSVVIATFIGQQARVPLRNHCGIDAARGTVTVRCERFWGHPTVRGKYAILAVPMGQMVTPARCTGGNMFLKHCWCIFRRHDCGCYPAATMRSTGCGGDAPYSWDKSVPLPPSLSHGRVLHLFPIILVSAVFYTDPVRDVMRALHR